MRLIAITLPRPFEGEAEIITALLRAGLQTLHLRKPGLTAGDMEQLIGQIPAELRTRLVMHDHFELVRTLGLGGLHLNGRNPAAPPWFGGQPSRSCHTLDEVKVWKPKCRYVFLSPIFDSISKEGYGSAFSPETLQQARLDGIIDHKVIALGGIGLPQIARLKAWGFGGAALLGDIWQREPEDIVPHFLKLQQEMEEASSTEISQNPVSHEDTPHHTGHRRL